MEYQIFLLILLVAFIPRTILGHNVTTGKIVVDGTTKIAETDENFICFTLDIWPHDECSQPNLCVWDSHASVLNLDLSLPILNKAVQGNELGGANSIGASVSAAQYAKDLLKLREMVDRLYENSQQKPMIVAPGAFFDDKWYHELVTKTGPNVVTALTHHIYNMGAGDDPKLIYRFVNPTYLSEVSKTFRQLKNIVEKHAPWSSAWVGEAGGAYHGGAYRISDTFINSFWYLDQLGMASLYNTKVYCRQTLVGGFYSVLKAKTFVPTPDYYGALLFHRLMGPGVLKVYNEVSPYLRTYAHCSREKSGVTMLFINLSNTTEFTINVEDPMNLSLHKRGKPNYDSSSNDNVGTTEREEYHLTPQNGLLRSSTVLLNGKALELTKEGELPDLTPIYRDSNSSINIATWSIAFVVIPDFVAIGCN
ncbi:heparanase-like protein 1 [Cucumis melo]|uniref:Heparanase-like protein 1 n=1 Tax=Cucumis melo TaxID=3656 RepID=A0ABM3L225_CUCME|nr:heparanase-like protein 1 [Cucumis melo]